MNVSTPDYAAHDTIETIVHLCSSSARERFQVEGTILKPSQGINSLTDLHRHLNGIRTEDPFLMFTKVQLDNQLSKPSVVQNQDFEFFVSSLTHYQNCVSTYICYDDYMQEMTNHDRISDLPESLETKFKLISQNIPGSLLDAFGLDVQLCINSWASLPFATRSLLKISVLKTSVFQDLSKCKWIQPEHISDLFSYGGQPLSGRPPVSAVVKLLADIRGRVATHAKSAVLGNPATYTSMDSGSKPPLFRDDITNTCMITWKLELQESSEIYLSNRFETVKMTAEELLKCRMEAFNDGMRKKYVGPIDCVPEGQPTQYADSIIARVIGHIGNHKFLDVDSKLSVIVANETNVSPEVNLQELSSLSKETWISEKIIHFAIQAHALCIGACCDMFPDPLANGPKVYYACSWFYSLCVMGTTQWTAGINWDWLIAPTFVDAGHFITLAISFPKKAIVALDSFGISRDSHLSNMHRWALLQGTDANGWTLKNVPCPKQGNAFDCGILTILTSAYLPACKTDSSELSRYYGQHSADSVRGRLAESIYRSGERFRLTRWNLL